MKPHMISGGMSGQVDGYVHVDLNREHYKEKIVNEYVPEQEDLYDFSIDNICTVE